MTSSTSTSSTLSWYDLLADHSSYAQLHKHQEMPFSQQKEDLVKRISIAMPVLSYRDLGQSIIRYHGTFQLNSLTINTRIIRPANDNLQQAMVPQGPDRQSPLRESCAQRSRESAGLFLFHEKVCWSMGAVKFKAQQPINPRTKPFSSLYCL
jgi:hypothetical protein